MEAAANLTFSGNTHNTAEMQIDGGTWTAVATVSVNTGTTIRLRALSSGSYSTTTTINTAVNGTAEGGAFNITTRDAVAPVAPDSLVMADVATAAELTNVTATASGGETTGSYVQVSPDNSNWYANGTSFGSRTRNVEHTWYARNVGEDGSFSTSFSNTHTPGYLAPDTSSIAGTNDTIEYLDTTATTTVSGVLSGHTYVVKKNNGDNDKPRSAIFTANGALTISDNGVSSPPGLPLLGTKRFFYEFLVYRNTAAGGAGAPAVDDDWVETNRQFSVTRNSEAVTAPDGFNFTPTTTATANVSVTVEGTGGSGGTYRGK